MDIKCKIEFFPDQFDEMDYICDKLVSEGWVLSKTNTHTVISKNDRRIVSKSVSMERDI